MLVFVITYSDGSTVYEPVGKSTFWRTKREVQDLEVREMTEEELNEIHISLMSKRIARMIVTEGAILTESQWEDRVYDLLMATDKECEK